MILIGIPPFSLFFLSFLCKKISPSSVRSVKQEDIQFFSESFPGDKSPGYYGMSHWNTVDTVNIARYGQSFLY